LIIPFAVQESRLSSLSKHNPKGYFAHPEIVSLHGVLLQALGSRWDDYLFLRLVG
jgi:hypothetical protein